MTMTTKEGSPRPHTLSGLALTLKEKLKPNGHKQNGAAEKGKAAHRHEIRRIEKQEKEERHSRDIQERENRWKREHERARSEEDEEMLTRYGMVAEPEDLPAAVRPSKLATIESVTKLPIGTKVGFRARIHTQRRMSPKLDFLLFRDQTHSVQGVLAHTSTHMIRWVQKLHPESLVYVTGTLKEPPVNVRSATEHNVEVDVYSVHLVAAANDIPWDNYEPPEALSTRLQARILDIRHPSNIAIFKIRSKIVSQFRRTLEDRDFLEIQTPKLQPAATESGAEVFKVNYFGRRAFLAQSPQLAKQMAISADLRKVFEVSIMSCTI